MVFFIPGWRAKRMGVDAIQVGLAGQTFGVLMILFSYSANTVPGLGWGGRILAVLGTCVLVAGSRRFAKFRRRSPWWGILGLFNIAGVLALLLIPRGKSSVGFDLMAADPRRDVWKMEVHVKVQDLREPVLLHLPRGASVDAAARSLSLALPHLEQALRNAKFLINGKPAQRGDDLSDQDTLDIATSALDRA